VDVTSYADLAVRLVNTAEPARRDDGLASVDSYRAVVADRPHLGGRVTVSDLETLRLLREELRLIFTAAAEHDDAQVVERLNALLTRHPIHQQITSHDGQDWHIHLVESGSAADRLAAPAPHLRRRRVRAGPHRHLPGRGQALLLGPVRTQGQRARLARGRAGQQSRSPVHRRELTPGAAPAAVNSPCAGRRGCRGSRVTEMKPCDCFSWSLTIITMSPTYARANRP
jgi:hypothetical protein